MKETETKTLAAKLAAIGKEIGAVDKSGHNVQQKYEFIEYGVVAGKIRELFDKYRIIIIPSVEGVQQEAVTNKFGNTGYHYVLTMSFTLINGDDPQDREVAAWSGEAIDYGDKGINKAETAGTKYFLMRLFNVSEKGDEDADGVTPEKMVAQKSKPSSQLKTTQIKAAQERLRKARTMAELKQVYSSLGSIAAEPSVVQLKDKLKTALAAQENTPNYES